MSRTALQAAMVIARLPPKEAARVLSRLSPAENQAIATHLDQLPSAAARESVDLLREFLAAGDAPNRARDNTLVTASADQDAKALADLLRDEQPQTIATTILVLPSDLAARVLAQLSETTRKRVEQFREGTQQIDQRTRELLRDIARERLRKAA